MEIEGIDPGKDFKLWPGGGRPWDWGETGTHHVPGIQPADVEELVKNGCRTIVLSRGRLLMLQICPETAEYLRSESVAIHVAETGKAVDIYNKLAADGEAVGGLFHSTC
jgi:hypothetical protein